VTRSPAKRLVAWLGSARVALTLMLLLAAMSFLGTLVPQTGRDAGETAAWAAAHPFAEKVVSALGLHSAYSSVIFLVPAALLVASTVICALARTRVARQRGARLREATSASAPSMDADFDVELGSGTGAEEALDLADAALRELGLIAKRDTRGLVVASNPLGAAGSPVFHWALVALLCTIAVGALSRADGLMGIPVGESAPVVADSFRLLSVGPWHRWNSHPNTIVVSELSPTYLLGGIDRGPTPTVAVVASSGRVLAEQRVYPNAPLHTGSLTVHANDYGLAPVLSLVRADSSLAATTSPLVDFSGAARGGTAPTEFAITDSAGAEAYLAQVTVELPNGAADATKALSVVPRLAVNLLDAANRSKVASATLGVGESLRLPDGSSLRFDALRYYARLSVVDDGSIPAVYLFLGLALVGLTAALLARQRLVVAWVTSGASGPRLCVATRLWRNAGVTRDEIRTALTSEFAEREERAGR
jgi:cytochrome c biogenesis protein